MERTARSRWFHGLRPGPPPLTFSLGDLMSQSRYEGLKREALTWAAWVAFMAVVYVLSVGPVGAVVQKKSANRAIFTTFQVVYYPVFYLHDRTPLRGALDVYAKLWGITNP